MFLMAQDRQQKVQDLVQLMRPELNLADWKESKNLELCRLLQPAEIIGHDLVDGANDSGSGRRRQRRDPEWQG